MLNNERELYETFYEEYKTVLKVAFIQALA